MPRRFPGPSPELGPSWAAPKYEASGFTLFEVLVALLIVAIAGVAAVQSFAVAARLEERSRVELALNLAAQEILAQARVQPLSPGTSRGELQEGPYLLRWSRRVAPTDAPPLQEVHVTVEAADQNAPPLELETFLSGL